jgi:arylsulfatase
MSTNREKMRDIFDQARRLPKPERAAFLDGLTEVDGPMRAQIGKFTLSGDGLCVGFDSGDNVSDQYKNPGTFTGGEILGVAVDVSEKAYIDLQKEAAAAFETD